MNYFTCRTNYELRTLVRAGPRELKFAARRENAPMSEEVAHG